MLNPPILGLAAFLSCFSIACLSPTSTATPDSQVIGVAGGTVSGTDGTTVTIPAGALTSDVTITLTPMPSLAAPANVRWAGLPYSLGPNGTQFAEAVTVTLPFSPNQLAPGSTSNQVAVYTAPEGSTSFTSLGGTVVDSTNVQVQTTHFSFFAPGAPTERAACTADGGAFVGCWAGTTTVAEAQTSGGIVETGGGGGRDSEVTVATSGGFEFQSFFSLVLTNCALPWQVTGETSALMSPAVCQDTSNGSWTFQSGAASLDSTGTVMTVQTAGRLVDPVNGFATFTTTSTLSLQ